MGCLVEITLANDRFIKRENAKHMMQNRVTDVLSFPLVSASSASAGKGRFFSQQHLGDILVNMDQAGRQARSQHLLLRKEVAFLIVHSLLHLLGYDHDTPRNRLKMQSLESRIWGKINAF